MTPKRAAAVVFLCLWTFALLWSQAGAQVRWEPIREPGCGGWITSVQVSPHNENHIIVGGDLLSMGVSTNRGSTWVPVSGLKSTEIGDVTFHPAKPKTVWAGTMSGPYLSRDGGRTWEERRGGFPPKGGYHYSAPIEKVLYDPNDSTRILAFGGSSRRWGSPGKPLWGAVWESTNEGEKWTLLASLEGNIVSATFAAGSSSFLMVGVSDKGVFRSADGGKSWEACSSGLPHHCVERVVAHPKNPAVFWVALNAAPPLDGEKKCRPGGIYKTEDAGRSWHPQNEGLLMHAHENINLTARFKAFCVSVSDPNVLYTSDSAWDGAKIYRSSNGGASWDIVLRNPPHGEKKPLETAYFSGYGMTFVSVNPNDPNHVYAAGAEFIAASFDGGKTWTDLTSKKVPNAAGEHVWVGRGYSGLCCTNFRFDPWREGRSVLLAMDAGKCWESRDGMRSWTFRGSRPSAWGGGNDASFAKDGTCYVTTGQGGNTGGVLRGRLDEKGTWTPFCGEACGLPCSKKCVALGIYTLPNDSSKVWCVAGKKLYSSTDAGESWQLAFDGDELGWIAADPRVPTTFYVSGKSSVWKTLDGQKFSSIGGPCAAGRLAVDSKGRVLLAAYRGKENGLWRWDGNSWSLLKKCPYLINVSVDRKNPARILVAGNDDPYHDEIRSQPVSLSLDDGATWHDIGEGLPTRRATAVAFNPFDSREIIVGTGGCGFFRAKLPNGKGELPAKDRDNYRQHMLTHE
ncbi:MAG: hypothetical protein Q4D38_06050 [Planctomycetia bacterium]|nr:hypothetical protein [Planctomycetia bacterium]